VFVVFLLSVGVAFGVSLYLVLEQHPPAPIIVPVKFFVTNDSKMLSVEMQANLAGANAIWQQAGIRFDAVQAAPTKIPSGEIRRAASQGDTSTIIASPEFDSSVVNVYYAPDVAGYNGVAFPAYRLVLLSDSPKSLPERALAHELGHVLGLGHKPFDYQLMFENCNGTRLDGFEITTARDRAAGFGSAFSTASGTRGATQC
jgi:hypothetical protein